MRFPVVVAQKILAAYKADRDHRVRITKNWNAGRFDEVVFGKPVPDYAGKAFIIRDRYLIIRKTPAPVPGQPPGEDAVAYNSLQFKWGGFHGSGATISQPRISNLNVKPNGMSLTWNVGLSSWGLSDGDAGALACLFCLVDGQWVGGKFDWISTSRSTRDFKNVHSGYGGWDASAFNRAEAYAFVVVSSDGKRRSNVIMQKR